MKQRKGREVKLIPLGLVDDSRGLGFEFSIAGHKATWYPDTRETGCLVGDTGYENWIGKLTDADYASLIECVTEDVGCIVKGLNKALKGKPYKPGAGTFLMGQCGYER